jgi:peptidoglycan-associated lipoprotein
MRTSRFHLFAIAAVLILAADGCKKKAPEVVPETPSPAPQIEESKPANTAPTTAEPFPPQNVNTTPVEQSIDDLNRSGVLKTVYFAYDSNDIDAAATSVLQGNATWLKGHGRYNVEIGGHCDERGSIGYNVALGDRRAAAVKSYLVSLGADGAKLMTVSYGEEKPANPGHDEAAFSKNRRAEFTIKP